MAESHHNRRAHLKLNNEGVSLVELIVALLILTIITVPLLQVFAGAARVNQENAKLTAADVVASNVMEAVKVYGIDGTAAEFKNSGTFGMGSSVAAVAGKEPGYYLDPEADEDHPGAEHKDYACIINGITEGTRDFNVRVTVDTNYEHVSGTEEGHVVTSTYDRKTYDYAFFDREKSYTINPVEIGWYYDDAAIEWYKSLNDIYVDYASTINEQEGYTVIYANSATYAQLRNAIYRSTVLTIDKSYDDVTEKYYYYVSARLEYTFPAVFGGLNILSSPESWTRNLLGSEDDTTVKLEELENLFLLYVPYPFLAQTAFDQEYRNSVTADTAINYTPYMLKEYSGNEALKLDFLNDSGVSDQDVKVVNNTSDEISVFLAIQGNTDGELQLYKEGTGTVHFYSNADLSDTGAKKTIIEQIEYDKASIATITVEVFDKDVTDYDSATPIRILESTIDK